MAAGPRVCHQRRHSGYPGDGLINRVYLPFVTSCNILAVYWRYSILLEPLHVIACATIQLCSGFQGLRAYVNMSVFESLSGCPGYVGISLSSTRSSPENVSGGCQPILRVQPCRHRQHSLMRTARVRCAAQYGTITSRTPSGQTTGAYRTLWWPVLFSGDRANRSYGANCGMVPRFCHEMGVRDQKVLRRLE